MENEKKNENILFIIYCKFIFQKGPLSKCFTNKVIPSSRVTIFTLNKTQTRIHLKKKVSLQRYAYKRKTAINDLKGTGEKITSHMNSIITYHGSLKKLYHHEGFGSLRSIMLLPSIVIFSRIYLGIVIFLYNKS